MRNQERVILVFCAALLCWVNPAQSMELVDPPNRIRQMLIGESGVGAIKVLELGSGWYEYVRIREASSVSIEGRPLKPAPGREESPGRRQEPATKHIYWIHEPTGSVVVGEGNQGESRVDFSSVVGAAKNGYRQSHAGFDLEGIVVDGKAYYAVLPERAHAIEGHLAGPNREDLTAPAIDAWRHAVLKVIGLDYLHLSTPANQRPAITVFGKLNCGYTRRLLQDLLTDPNGKELEIKLALHYSTHEERESSVRLLCADNPRDALADFLNNDRSLDSGALCAEGTRQLESMQNSLRHGIVKSTPLIYTMHGKTQVGYNGRIQQVLDFAE